MLAALDMAGCRCWVGGGWGIDALVGQPTRLHRDLDLALNAEDERGAIEVLQQRGYVIETDCRPVRVELVEEGGGRVDLHPVAFDADGHGSQQDLDGGTLAYPPSAFTTGRLGGIAVGCLSIEQQQLSIRGTSSAGRTCTTCGCCGSSSADQTFRRPVDRRGAPPRDRRSRTLGA